MSKIDLLLNFLKWNFEVLLNLFKNSLKISFLGIIFMSLLLAIGYLFLGKEKTHNLIKTLFHKFLLLLDILDKKVGELLKDKKDKSLFKVNYIIALKNKDYQKAKK